MINKLNHEFPIRDLGDLHYFLGLEVHQKSHGIVVSQHKYICDLLDKIGMLDSNSCHMPIATKTPLMKNHGEPIPNKEEYKRFVGALQYITITRPNIAYGVNKLCQFMHNPRLTHWNALKRLFRYL